MHPVAATLNKIAAELKASFLEREDAIDAMMLALLAGEHAFLFGPPGTAKSELVRALVESLNGTRYFEVALSRTRPAEAVLGPLNIKEFRDNGNYFLKRKGFASDADICFFDEIGKMSPVLGHDMLALLNERVYHEVNGGRSVHPTPLHTAFTASNEMPTNESDDAAALWDRLLVRVCVDYLQKKSNFSKLLTSSVEHPKTRLDFEDLKKVVETEVPNIQMSKEALTGMVALRTKMAGERLFPSDRRWRASVKVLRAAAFLVGNAQVEEEQLSVLKFTLWDELEHIDAITDMCEAAGNPFAEALQTSAKLLSEVRKGLADRAGTDGLTLYGQEASLKLAEVRKSLDDLLTLANGRSIAGFPKAADEHRELLIEVFVQCMGNDRDVAELAVNKRLGLGGGSAVQIEVS